MAERITVDRPLPDTGGLESDLKAWGRSVAGSLRTPEGSAFLKVLVASAPTAGADVGNRLEALDRARERGEVAPQVDAVIDHLREPIYLRALLGTPAEDAFADHLVERLLT